MTAKDKNLNDLFLDTLKDVYYAEKQILKALPKMAKAAQSDKLRAAFEKHRGETEGQLERLEQIFEFLDGLVARRRLTRDHNARRVVEQALESHAKDEMIVGNQHPNGSGHSL